MHILLRMTGAAFEAKRAELTKAIKEVMPGMTAEQEKLLHIKFNEAFIEGMEIGTLDITELAAIAIEKIPVTLADLKEELAGERLEIWLNNSRLNFEIDADRLDGLEEALEVPIKSIKRKENAVIKIEI